MALTFTLVSDGGTIAMDGSLDVFGCKWWASATGWDGPDVDYATAPKPNDHGLFSGLSLYAGRTLIIGGIVTCPDVSGVRAARDRLDALCPAGSDVTITSAEGRTVTGRRSGPLLKKSMSEQQVQFSIPIVCADPFKYGQSRSIQLQLPQSGGGMFFPLYFPMALAGGSTAQDIFNGGTEDAAPVFLFTGPCSQPSVTLVDTGQSLGYNLILGTTDELLADMSDGSVLLNGQPARWTQYPTSQPFKIPPGTSTLNFNASYYSAAAGCLVSISDTYV